MLFAVAYLASFCCRLVVFSHCSTLFNVILEIHCSYLYKSLAKGVPSYHCLVIKAFCKYIRFCTKLFYIKSLLVAVLSVEICLEISSLHCSFDNTANCCHRKS
ncbi:Proteasome subunit alpha type-3 [Zea mays]|uniref:Proteasome subunit alpha type-3 n=1 Tax=Zea mays TaxID=4577 RepID=A0A1D6G9Q1_MAIZE|nr:Proteasome subunit alpha type-3 [Zea mays]